MEHAGAEPYSDPDSDKPVWPPVAVPGQPNAHSLPSPEEPPTVIPDPAPGL